MNNLIDDRDEEKFDSKIKQLRTLFEKDPELTDKELKNAIKRIKLTQDMRKHPILGDINIDVAIPIVISLGIVLVGLINIETFFIYIFGVVFFLAGYFVSFYNEGVGLIFLFSHGITGLCVMVGSMISKIGLSGLTDSTFSVRIFMGVALMLFIAGTVMSILCNLSKNFREMVKNLPLVIYFFGFLVTGILARYYSEIISL